MLRRLAPLLALAAMLSGCIAGPSPPPVSGPDPSGPTFGGFDVSGAVLNFLLFAAFVALCIVAFVGRGVVAQGAGLALLLFGFALVFAGVLLSLTLPLLVGLGVGAFGGGAFVAGRLPAESARADRSIVLDER